MADWEQAIRSLLAEQQGLTVHQIRAGLRANGSEPPPQYTLNSHLSRSRTTFRQAGTAGSLPRWYLRDGRTTPGQPSATIDAEQHRVGPAPLELYPWQRR